MLAELMVGLAGALLVVSLSSLSSKRPGPEGTRSTRSSRAGSERIRRAGLEGSISPSSLTLARGLGLALGLSVGLPLVPILPERTGAALAALAAGLGFLLPDLWLARRGRIRHRRMVAALPDSLDLLATVLGAGRTTGAALMAVARWGRGPLAGEFGLVARRIEAGIPTGQGLALLRERIGGPEVAAFTTGIERSLRLGSPLSEEMRRQASELRVRRRRLIVEQASRAAPKIQLVIALVLVPSVLLLVVAVLVANADRLIGAAFGSG